MGRCPSASVPHASSAFHSPPDRPSAPRPSPPPAADRTYSPSFLTGLCSSPGRNSGGAPHTGHSTRTPTPQPASRQPPRTGLGFGGHCRSRFVLPFLPSAQPFFSSSQYHLPQSSLFVSDFRLPKVHLPQSPLSLRDFSRCVLPYRGLSTPLPTLRLSFSAHIILPAPSHVILPSDFSPDQSSFSKLSFF